MRSFKGGMLFSVVVAVVFFGGGIAKSEEKLLFRHKFEEGKSYYVKQVTKQKVTQVIDGKEQVNERVTGFGYNFDVTEVDFDGNAWVSCKYDWAKVYVKSAQGEISFDSSEKKPSISQATVGFMLILGESFYMNITPLGKVKRVNGLDSIRSNIKNKIVPSPARKDVLNSLAVAFSEEEVKNVFEEFMAVFPEKEVSVGQYWDKTFSLGTRGNKSIHKKKWTLKSRRDGVSLIEFEGSFKPEPLKMSRGRRGVQGRYEMSGTSHGRIKVEESTGRIIRSEITEDSVGEYKSVVNGKRPIGAPPSVKIHTIKIHEMTRTESAGRSSKF